MRIKEKAADKIKDIFNSQENKGKFLRISLTKSCCGFNINFEAVTEKKEDDVEYEDYGLKYYVEKELDVMLKDAVMDCDEKGDIYLEGLSKNSCDDDNCDCH